MEEILSLARGRNVKLEGVIGKVVKRELASAAKEEKEKQEREEQ